MRMSSKLLLAVCLASLSALGSTAAPAQEKISLQLALHPAGSDVAVFLAEAKGWFKAAGLEVDVQDGRGSPYSLNLVGVGQKDVGQGELGPMIVAIEKGVPVKSIAGWARRNDMSIIVDRDSPINSPQGLKGKSVVISNSGTWEPVLDSFLRHNGMTRNDLTLVPVSSAAMYTTYSSGKTDAMFGIGPYTSPIVNRQRPSKAIDASAFGMAGPGTGLFVKSDMIARRRPALEKLVKVYIDAWTYIYSGHEDEAVQAVLKLRPNDRIDPRVIREQIDGYHQYFNTPNTAGKPYGWQSEQDWADTIAQMEEIGQIRRGRKPSDFYTNELVDAVTK